MTHPLLTGPELGPQALCAEIGGEDWFPEDGHSSREAKRVCAGCEVRAACLEWALATNERFGIWGGLSARERRGLAHKTRKLQPISHGSESGYKQHRRRGEKPCEACRKANRAKSRVSYRATKAAQGAA